MKKMISLFLSLIMCMSLWIVCAEEEDATGLVNLALNKPAMAANQYGDSIGFAPYRAVDGQLNTAYSNGSNVIGEEIDGANYFVVDLQGMYDLTQVIVRTRRDVNDGAYRKGWLIEVSTDSSFKQRTEIGSRTVAGEFGSDTVIDLKEPVTARYILVRQTDRFLVISEVEAYGHAAQGKAVNKGYDDVSDAQHNPLWLAQSLGIMSGLTKNEFGVNKLVTRSEAARISALTANILEIKTEKSSFSDVESDDINIGYIEACVQNGIVSEGEKFRPDDFVKGTEFLKMLTGAMGYNDLTKTMGPFPANVITLANDLNLLKGVSLMPETDINRGTMLTIIYNALLTETNVVASVTDNDIEYIEGETLLKKAFGLELLSGTVTANDITGLISPKDLGKNAIEIDGCKFVDDSGMLREFIGQNICFLADDEEHIKGGWENKKKNTVYTVYTKDFNHNATTKTSVETFDSEGNITKYTLENPLYVLKNGEAYDGYVIGGLDFANGTVHLIDNNGDDIIDVMHIFEPKVIVADYAFEKDGKVSVGGINGEFIKEEGYKYFNVLAGGAQTYMEEIAKGNLVYAYISENKKSVVLHIFRNAIEGTVTEVRSDGFSVDGTSFGFSEYFTENKSRLSTLVPAMKAKFILDEHNNLVWIDEVALGKAEDVLAMVMNYDVQGELSNIKIKVFNEEKNTLVLELDDKVNIDGTTYSQDNLRKLLDVNPKYLIGKFTLYNTNKEGKITDMDTENFDASKEPDSQMVDMGISLGGAERRTKNGIYNSHTLLFPIMEDFPMFIVPADSDKVPLTGGHYDQFYSISSIDKKCPVGAVKLGGETKFYGTDEFGCPNFCVNFKIIDDATESAGYISDMRATGFLVDEVIHQVNSYGDVCYGINGYNISTGLKETLIIKDTLTCVVDIYQIHKDVGKTDIPADVRPNANWFDFYYMINTNNELNGISAYQYEISTLKRGDIIRFEETDGEVDALERVFRNEKRAEFNYGKLYSAGDAYSNISSAFRVYFAGFESAKRDMLTIKTGTTAKDVFNYANMTGGFYVIENNRIMKYDLKEIPAYITESSDLVAISIFGNYNTVVAYND